MHVGGAHNSDMAPNLCQKPSAKFDYGMNGVCNDGAWGLGQLEDHFRPLRDQCAYVSSTCGSTTFPYCSSTDTTKVNNIHFNGGCGTTWQSSFKSHNHRLNCWMPIGSKSHSFTWANISVNFKHRWHHVWKPKGLKGNGDELGSCGSSGIIWSIWCERCQTKQMEGASTHTPPLYFRPTNLRAKLPREVTFILSQIACKKI